MARKEEAKEEERVTACDKGGPQGTKSDDRDVKIARRDVQKDDLGVSATLLCMLLKDAFVALHLFRTTELACKPSSTPKSFTAFKHTEFFTAQQAWRISSLSEQLSFWRLPGSK